MSHIFISYISKDAPDANRLGSALRECGFDVKNRDTIPAGSSKRTAVRRAIENASAFVACFSADFHSSGKTEMNAELQLAIEQLRQRPHDQAWYIPVKLSECEIPDIDIGGAGETLRDFASVDLYDNWKAGVQQILSAIQPSPIADDHTVQNKEGVSVSAATYDRGIPSEIYSRLRQTLLDCGPFGNDNQLRAVFAHEKLRPFLNGLPEASSLADRVDAAIAYLVSKHRAKTKENALVLLLQISSQRTDPGDECHRRLASLADELKDALEP
jgi:hypothetical protein